MKKLFTLTILVTITCFFIVFSFFTNGSQIIKRIVFDKYTLSLSSSLKDFKYDVDLFINQKTKEYPVIRIVSSKKNYIRVQNQLESIFKNYVFSGEQFKGTKIDYPVNVLNENNNSSKADLKLFGMNPDHYRDPNSHSFRLKYKKSIFFGKRQENFLKPVTRTYGIDYMWNVLFNDLSGGIKIDYKPIKILYNNIDYGYYYKEPFFDKYIIELNEFRDGEIFEIYNDSVKINHLPDSKDFSEFKSLSSYNKNEILSLIDIDMVYDLVTISIISGSSHCLRNINLHWYHNPVINKLQPTLREIGVSSEVYINKDSTTIKKITENITNDNSLINLLYSNDKQIFISGLKKSFSKVSNYFNNDKILDNNELKIFFKTNPTNDKFSEYYNSIQKNISYLTPFFKDQTLRIEEKETIYFKKDFKFMRDTLFINKNIFFDEGYNFEISNNSLIEFENCNVTIGGDKELTSFFGNQKTSGSLFFSGSKVNITKTFFLNIQPPFIQNEKIPSSITFYECSVNIKESHFENNLFGDDYLNFFRCKDVLVQKSIFKNIFSDAIDSDFSNIDLYNNFFENIGNDAIDLSGSTSNIYKNSFTTVSDKCISVGENSSCIIENNIFKNSELSIVVKDGSSIESRLNSFDKIKIEYVFFVKKPYYGPPKINEIEENNPLTILSEKNIVLDNLNLDCHNVRLENKVESLLYGRQYGKSSK